MCCVCKKEFTHVWTEKNCFNRAPIHSLPIFSDRNESDDNTPFYRLGHEQFNDGHVVRTGLYGLGLGPRNVLLCDDCSAMRPSATKARLDRMNEYFGKLLSNARLRTEWSLVDAKTEFFADSEKHSFSECLIGTVIAGKTNRSPDKWISKRECIDELLSFSPVGVLPTEVAVKAMNAAREAADEFDEVTEKLQKEGLLKSRTKGIALV
jgi:hypothetical protein